MYNTSTIGICHTQFLWWSILQRFRSSAVAQNHETKKVVVHYHNKGGSKVSKTNFR